MLFRSVAASSKYRQARPGYPTERQLYAATDLDGKPQSYLSSEDRFRTVRELEQRNRVIPVVGDLSGPTAMKAIGKFLAERGLKVSAFYVSNVEMYLFRSGSFPRFVENVRALPFGPSSMIVRSVFGRGMTWGGGVAGGVPVSSNPPAPVAAPAAPQVIPQALPGHLSAQVLQPFSTFLELTARPETLTYWDLLASGAVDLRAPARQRRPRRRRAALSR